MPRIGGKRVSLGTKIMTTVSVASLSALYNRLFPERQIYHRCNGQVQFTTISGRTQLVALTGMVLVLGWVAYASVNVMFTEQINARMQSNLKEQKRRFDTELSSVMADYERLQTGVMVVRDELEVALRELEERQQQVDAVFDQQSSLHDQDGPTIDQMRAHVFAPPEPSRTSSVSVLNTIDPDPVPRQSRPVEFVAAPPVDGLSMLFRDVSENLQGQEEMSQSVTIIAGLERRVAQLQNTQFGDLIELEEVTGDRIARLETALRQTGVDFMPEVERHMLTLESDGLNGQGGPFISATADDLSSEELDSHAFARKTFRIGRHLRYLSALQKTFGALPVTRPTDAYRITSPFGVRSDPFTGRLSKHAGIDIGGRRGTPVVATASGKVKKAGFVGGYGRLVSIKHGNGFETVFGHLNSIKVKSGDVVKRGDVIGTLGNTGRSTAPHLHYEIKYNGKARDPMHFFEAGRYVFENEG